MLPAHCSVTHTVHTSHGSMDLVVDLVNGANLAEVVEKEERGPEWRWRRKGPAGMQNAPEH